MAQMQSTDDRRSARRQSEENFKGLFVIGLLALLTILEFVVAIVLDDPLALVIGLTPFALAKAWFIIHYFMHVYKLWRGEEDHS